MTKIIPLNEVFKIGETNVFYYLSKEELLPTDNIVAQNVEEKKEQPFKMELGLTKFDGIKNGHWMYFLTDNTPQMLA